MPIIYKMGNCSDLCKRELEMRDRLATNTLDMTNETAITQPKLMCLPLKTDRSKIVDSFGRRIKLCCYNLKGCHSTKACVSILESLTIQELAKQIQQKGFNTAIIPFSLDLYFQNPIIDDECLGPNLWMKGKTALQILDITINGLTSAGVLVILRNACSKATYFKEFTESDGLWWNSKYSEAKWIECLGNLAKRYAHNPRMIAIQIRHSLRKTSNHQPRWGSGGVSCDWKRAALLACNEVLEKNDNILVIIPGDQRGDLRKISESPLELSKKNRLVFVAKLKHSTQRIRRYDDLVSALNQDLNCIRRIGFPLILTAITDRREQDWKLIIKYLQESDLDWGYSSCPKTVLKDYRRDSMDSLFSNEKIAKYLNRIQKSTVGCQNRDPSQKQTLFSQ